ncbi:MAG: response regulator [Desulfobacterales bacterium]|nr:response regulator [Desulfobacterales bacterium]
MDDDSILRGVAGESLKQAGFSVSEAENGVQALAAIKRSRPDIVLLDVMMPEMDGFDTCRAIRGLPNGDMLPVVMITALEDLDSINKAYEVGATDFITKPINWVILVQRVRYMLRAVQMNLERNRLQQELQHAQRLKAIGTLASGIAHDFKNLLQIIQGSVELLLLNKTDGDPDYADLQEIFSTSRIGHELVQQMLAYSRSLKSEKKNTDLNAQISRTGQRLQKSLPESVSLQLRLDQDLPAVAVDAVQMEQVLMNLATNARDAMPEGGTLGIQTSTIELTQAFCRRHPKAKPGAYVCLRVSDTGEGMEPGTRDRIFEPFFSTKEVGKGTGLGLSMAYGIIQNHDGLITCNSRPGQGTTFNVLLPLQSGQTFPQPVSLKQPGSEAQPKKSADPPKSVPEKTVLEKVVPEKTVSQENSPGQTVGKKTASKETILLVDDEHLIRQFGKRRLEFEGYTVITASDAEEALELFREKKDRIDVILLDLMMPGIGGKKCLAEILQIDPQAKIVIASAYSPGDGSLQELIKMASGHLRKPYLSEQLLEVVRTTLDGS